MLVESPSDADVRPPIPADLALPAGCGPFEFPEPYRTFAVRLTDPSTAPQGTEPVGYSYWSNVNNHEGQSHLYAVIGRVGDTPLLITVDKQTWGVSSVPIASGTAEGWYFSATEPSILYRQEGSRLLRHDIDTGAIDAAFTSQFGSSIWQCHTSADGRTHSATVRDGDYRDLGCLAVLPDGSQRFFERRDGYDECQIDASGRFLVIKEGVGDNRIVDLLTGQERTLANADGAVGHSDCGDGLLVGEDDMHEPGALVLWDLAALDGRRLLWQAPAWGPGLGHVSVRGSSALVSNASREAVPRANELLLIPLDGSQQARVLAPCLTDLDAPGGGDDYRKRPKANLDPTGQYACWTANCGGDRLDLFLVRCV